MLVLSNTRSAAKQQVWSRKTTAAAEASKIPSLEDVWMYGLGAYYAVTSAQMPNVGHLRRVSESKISIFFFLRVELTNPEQKLCAVLDEHKLEAVLIRRIAKGSCSSQSNNMHACAIEQHIAVLKS